jgi:hypothetical protein
VNDVNNDELVEAVARALANNDPSRSGGDYYADEPWKSYVGKAKQFIAAHKAMNDYYARRALG